MVVALLCVPWMLVAKPLVLRHQYLRRKHLVGDYLFYLQYENELRLKNYFFHLNLGYVGSRCLVTCKTFFFCVFLGIKGRWVLLEAKYCLPASQICIQHQTCFQKPFMLVVIENWLGLYQPSVLQVAGCTSVPPPG